MTSTKQDLALSAALLPADHGILMWQTLREQSTVEDLDHTVTRVLPYVYENCKELLVGNDLLKLRGSRRHTWAKNTEFYMQFKPVLHELHKNAIDYRILKGGAINLLIGPPGFRIMGDIDLLVRKKDLSKVRKLFESAGFKPKFSFGCKHNNFALKNLEVNYCNDQSLEIDIHVAEERSPRELFIKMLHRPPLLKEFSGIPVLLPAAEFLIAHALIHGGLQVQIEDEAQAILDVHFLLNSSNFVATSALMQDLGATELLVAYLKKAETLLGSTPFRYAPQTPKLKNQISRIKQNIWGLSQDIYTLLLAIKYRRPRLGDAVPIYRHAQKNRALYVFWLYTGMIRQIERFAIKSRGGFSASSSTISDIHSVSRWSNDWRFSVPAKEGLTQLQLKLTSKNLEFQSFLVFVNGILAGVTENSPSFEYILTIVNPSAVNEVSLRLPFAGCKACAQSMADLRIELTTPNE